MSASPRTVASQIAAEVAAKLDATRTAIVLAESCTAGLVSATLAEIPGISSWLCGSAVVYQEHTKKQWLGVDGETLNQHTAVSATVARQMAAGVLATTVQADLSAAITGHLGPGAPPHQDGLVFIAVARRHHGEDEIRVLEFRLVSKDRRERQHEAACIVLKEILAALDDDR